MGSAAAIAYLRASTAQQDLSPEAQRAAIEAWAAREGATVASWHEDKGVGGAAALDHRPGLMAALGALKPSGAAFLVVAKRDRLARDVVLAAMIERLAERAGARVVTADGTANGTGPEAQLMRRIVDAFAEYERALIRARTKAALAAKSARGERVGNVPYGYYLARDGVHLEPNPAEERAIARARALRAKGLSLRVVGLRLIHEGHYPREGRTWHKTQISRLVGEYAEKR